MQFARSQFERFRRYIYPSIHQNQTQETYKHEIGVLSLSLWSVFCWLVSNLSVGSLINCDLILIIPLLDQ